MNVWLRHYTASYSYVGGYYGGCNELEMKKALVKNGPLSVSFEVKFFTIKSISSYSYRSFQFRDNLSKIDTFQIHKKLFQNI